MTLAFLDLFIPHNRNSQAFFFLINLLIFVSFSGFVSTQESSQTLNAILLDPNPVTTINKLKRNQRKQQLGNVPPPHTHTNSQTPRNQSKPSVLHKAS